MTDEEISRIKEHIEIHARREPASIKITEIMHRAVAELEHITELERENAELKAIADFQTLSNMDRYFQLKKLKERLTEAKNHIHRLLVLLTEGKRSYAVIDEARAFLQEVEK